MVNNRDRFVKKSLESIADKDSSYGHFFLDKDGRKLSDDVYRDRRSMLESSLNKAYDERVKDRLKVRGLQRLATPLRYLAGLNYGVGTALFAGLPGPAGFGFTTIGAGVSLLADVIDSYYYNKADLIKGKIGTNAKLAAESVAGKGLGYLPIGTGLIDLYRGRRKFTNTIIDGMVYDEDVVNYAIGQFTDELYGRKKDRGNARVIPLAAFRDKRYGGKKEMKSAA